MFPVGTRLYKQFVVSGMLIETRFLQKLAPSTWFSTTYAWNASGTATTRPLVEVRAPFGTEYRIPAETDCPTCHLGSTDMVLGFELASLANDGMHEIVQQYPDLFPCFVASLPLNNVAASLEEMDRAIGSLGAKGIQIFTNRNCRPTT